MLGLFGELTCSRRRLSVSVFTALALGAALLLSLSAVAGARTPVRLVHNWYSYGPHDEVWQALIESFNEENADYVIEPVSGGSDDQLRTLMAAGSAPDVVDFDRFRVVDWAHQGLFMPLDRLLAGRIDVRREFLPGPVNEVVFEGQVYGVPFDTDIRGLIWNRRLLAESGLDDQRGPATWEALNDYIRALTRFDDTGAAVRFGLIPWTGNWWSIGWIWHFGGSLYDPATKQPTLDHERNVAAYEWMGEWTQRYGTFNALSNEGYGPWWLDPFFEERQAMMVAHAEPITVARQIYGLDVDAAPLPAVVPGANGAWSGGFSFVIPEGAANPAGAAAVIEHFTSVESQLLWWRTFKRIPTRLDALAAIDAGQITPAEARLLDLVDQAHWRPPYFGQIIIPRLDEVNAAVWNGEQSPGAALQEAQAVAAQMYRDVFGQ